MSTEIFNIKFLIVFFFAFASFLVSLLFKCEDKAHSFLYIAQRIVKKMQLPLPNLAEGNRRNRQARIMPEACQLIMNARKHSKLDL
jgi:hypothetical protein